MSNQALQNRIAISASDFVIGVKPILESQLKVVIHPLEALASNELMQKLDQSGIDSFYFDENGNPRGLASRVNYARAAALRPEFSFRYARWNAQRGEWDYNREFHRKIDAACSPNEFILFPKLHVESYSRAKGTGNIGWAFGADTKQILQFITENFNDERKVRIYEPRVGERRLVITASVEAFAKSYSVIEARGSTGNG